MNANLKNVLGLAYRAKVLSQSPIQVAFSAFSKAASADPEFLAAAQAELARAQAIEDGRCFISKQNTEFLTRAFELTGQK